MVKEREVEKKRGYIYTGWVKKIGWIARSWI